MNNLLLESGDEYLLENGEFLLIEELVVVLSLIGEIAVVLLRPAIVASAERSSVARTALRDSIAVAIER